MTTTLRLFCAVLLFGPLTRLCLSHRTYTSRIPNGDIMGGFGGQGVGHMTLTTGGGSRNDFGQAFNAAGKGWTADLCQADADGDGMSNGYELGDPCCTWTPGASDWRGKRTLALTQPGLQDSAVTTEHACPAEQAAEEGGEVEAAEAVEQPAAEAPAAQDNTADQTPDTSAGAGAGAATADESSTSNAARVALGKGVLVLGLSKVVEFFVLV